MQKLAFLASTSIVISTGAQLTNILGPTTVASAETGIYGPQLGTYASPFDGDLSTGYASYAGQQAGATFQIDLEAPTELKAIYIGMKDNVYQNKFDIFFGDIDQSGNYASNKKCGDDVQVGLVKCEGTGRYLVWELENSGAVIAFSEIMAFQAPVVTIDSITQTGMTISAGDLVRLYEATDNSKQCILASVHAGIDVVLDIDLDDQNQVVQTLAVWTTSVYGATNMQSILVETVDDGVSTSCGTITLNSSEWMHTIDCAGKTADSVKLTIEVASSGWMNGLCNIGIFGVGGSNCREEALTYSENAWTLSTVVFDLLKDSSKTIELPTLAISPSGCYTTTWKVYRTSDDKDMVVESPLKFSFTSTSLVYTLDINSASDRLSLFGSETYYLQGTTDFDTPQVTAKFTFQIDHQDACRTSIIASKPPISITMKFDEVGTHQEVPFSDSVDAAGAHSFGVCGEKQIVVQTPRSFYTLSADSTDPINNKFTIGYDPTSAVEADIKTYTIGYTVTSKEYAAQVDSLSSTMSFTIECPTNVMSSSLVTAIQSEARYDLASGSTLELAVPVVTLSPSSCFSVQTFEVTDTNSGNVVTYASIGTNGFGQQVVQVKTDDFALSGQQFLTIKAVVSNGQKVQAHNFAIEMYDTCSTLVPTIQLAGFSDTINALDILVGTEAEIKFPTTAQVTPAGCNFALTFSFHLKSSDENMVTKMPNVFSLTVDSVKITNVLGDYSLRHNLYDLEKIFVLRGTASDSHKTVSDLELSLTFTDACRGATIVPKIVKVEAVTQDQKATFIQLPYDDSVDRSALYSYGTCGEKIIELTEPTPQFLTVVKHQTDPINQNVEIDYDNQKIQDFDYGITTVGFYVKFKEYEDLNASLTGSFDFEILCPDKVISSELVTPMTAQISLDISSELSLSLKLPDVSYSPQKCFQVLSYEVRYALSKDLAPFASVQDGQLIIKLEDQKLHNTTQLLIAAVMDNGERLQQHSFEVSFTETKSESASQIETQANILSVLYQKPKLVPSPQIRYDFTYGQSIEIFLGETSPPNSQNVTVAVQPDFNTASDFLQYDPDERKIFSKRPLAEGDIQVHQIKVKLVAIMQDIELENVYRLALHVSNEKDFESSTTVENEIPVETQEDKVNEEQVVFTQKIFSLDQSTSDMSNSEAFEPVPVSQVLTTLGLERGKALADRQKELVLEQVIETGVGEVRFQKLTTSGRLTFVFTKQINLPNDIEQIINLQREVSRRLSATELEEEIDIIEVAGVKGDQGDEDFDYNDPDAPAGVDPISSWNLTHFNRDGFGVQLYFDQPLEVSQGTYPDRVFVQINFDSILKGTTDINGNKMPKSILKQTMIPAQFENQEQAQTFDEVAQTQSTLAKVFALSNFSLGVLLSAGLHFLWGMINSLQIVTHMPLLNTKSPANANEFNLYLIQIANFEIFDSAILNEKLFFFPEDEPYTLNFLQAEYDTMQMIPGQGLVFYILTFYATLIVLHLTFFLLAKKIKKVKQIRKKLSKMIYWNPLQRLFMEGYLSFFLYALINGKKFFWHIKLGSLNFSNILCIVFLVLCPILPIVLIANLAIKKDKWKKSKFKDKQGELISGLKTKRKSREVLLLPAMFFLSRMVFTLSCVLWQDFFWGMIAIQLAVTLIQASIVLHIKPFESKLQFVLEIFNGFTTLSVLYCAVCFSDLIPDVRNRPVAGIMFIVIVAVNVCTHLIILLNNTACKMKKKAKKIYLKKQANKAKKESCNNDETEAKYRGQLNNIDFVDSAEPKVKTPCKLLSNVASQVIQEVDSVDEKDQDFSSGWTESEKNLTGRERSNNSQIFENIPIHIIQVDAPASEVRDQIVLLPKMLLTDDFDMFSVSQNESSSQAKQNGADIVIEEVEQILLSEQAVKIKSPVMKEERKVYESEMDRNLDKLYQNYGLDR